MQKILYERFIKKAIEAALFDISRDSTAIEARENVCAEAKERAKEKKAVEEAKKAHGKTKRGRPKKGEERVLKELTRLER
ncbi:MAG: hypothetical protein K2X28_04480 [Alphaproteobacteria bacterium]|nr:hypothetical protein [Alphaproteobacteria bacterium]